MIKKIQLTCWGWLSPSLPRCGSPSWGCSSWTRPWRTCDRRPRRPPGSWTRSAWSCRSLLHIHETGAPLLCCNENISDIKIPPVSNPCTWNKFEFFKLYPLKMAGNLFYLVYKKNHIYTNFKDEKSTFPLLFTFFLFLGNIKHSYELDDNH